MKGLIFIKWILAIILSLASNMNSLYDFKYIQDYDKTPESVIEEVRNEEDAKWGVRMTFLPTVGNRTEDQIQSAKSVFKVRLYNAGYMNATINEAENGEIIVEIPGVDESEFDTIEKLLTAAAVLTFEDADGVVVLEGTEDIKSAEAMYGIVTEDGEKEYYIELKLNEQAVEKFAYATKLAAARIADGTNYIAIRLDDNIISSPKVTEEIIADVCVIAGIFETDEDAKMFANYINSGTLPFDVMLSQKSTYVK